MSRPALTTHPGYVTLHLPDGTECHFADREHAERVMARLERGEGEDDKRARRLGVAREWAARKGTKAGGDRS